MTNRGIDIIFLYPSSLLSAVNEMERLEPVDEFNELMTRVWAKIRSFLPKNRHVDLKRTYGHECAGVLLKDVRHPDHYFYLSNGAVLKSICDLDAVLQEMDLSTFSKHVSPHKNEFAAWVGHIVGDSTLANKLQLLDTREDMARAVNVRVNWLRSRANEAPSGQAFNSAYR